MSLNIYWQFRKFTEVYWYIYENVSKYVGFVEAIYEIFSKYFFWHAATLVLCWLMYRWSSADWCTAGPFWFMYCWSSAGWCTAGPLLIYVLLALCWLMHSSAVPLLTDVTLILCCLIYYWSNADWCTAAPLLTDVPLVLCWLMYCWSSADLCTAGPLLTDSQYCWSSKMYHRSSADWCTVQLVLCWLMYCSSSAAWCTAGPLLPAALPVCHWLTQCALFLLKWPGTFTEFSVKNSKCTERFTKYSALIFSVYT